MSKFLVFSPSRELYLLDRLNYKFFDSRVAERIYDWPSVEQLKDSRKKIAVIKWIRYQHGLDYNDFSWADLIICTSSEIVHEPWEIYDRKSKEILNHNNIIYIVGGINNSYINSYPQDKFFFPYLFFFLTVAKGNEPVLYGDQRPFLFDALLGQKKPYRLKLFDKLKQHGLLDKCLVSLKDSRYMSGSVADYQSPDFDLYEDPYVLDLVRKANGNLVDAYLGNGVDKTFPYTEWKISASALVPHKMYQNSWFSIVAESEQNNYTFYTEKTSKCFFGKRIFVMFASQGHLKKLREFGFRTFDGIIDESYDNEPDADKRFEQAFSQVLFLVNSNPKDLYEKAKPILDHNFKILTENDLTVNKIKSFISDRLDQL